MNNKISYTFLVSMLMSSLLTVGSNPRTAFLDKMLPKDDSPQAQKFCKRVWSASLPSWLKACKEDLGYATPTKQEAIDAIRHVVCDMAHQQACYLIGSDEQAQQVAAKIHDQLDAKLSDPKDDTATDLYLFIGEDLAAKVATTLKELDQSTTCGTCNKAKPFSERIYFLKSNKENKLRTRCCGKWACHDCMVEQLWQNQPAECPFCQHKMPSYEQIMASVKDPVIKEISIRMLLGMLLVSNGGQKTI